MMIQRSWLLELPNGIPLSTIKYASHEKIKPCGCVLILSSVAMECRSIR